LKTLTAVKAESKSRMLSGEPLHRLTMYSLAGYRITTLPTLQILLINLTGFQNGWGFAERKRFERLIRLSANSLFSRQLPWPSGLSPIVWMVRFELTQLKKQRCYRPLQLSNFVALTFYKPPSGFSTADGVLRKQNDSNIHQKANNPLFCRWTMFPFCWPGDPECFRENSQPPS
jgi:hypothetical protein